jgi:hypothetical protein
LNAVIDGDRYQVEGSIPLETLRDLEVLKPGPTKFYTGVYRAEFSHTVDGAFIRDGWRGSIRRRKSPTSMCRLRSGCSNW